MGILIVMSILISFLCISVIVGGIVCRTNLILFYLGICLLISFYYIGFELKFAIYWKYRLLKVCTYLINYGENSTTSKFILFYLNVNLLTD